jgi:hypothetical protein
MKEVYPISLPVRYDGYPAAIKMTCGQKIPAPYSYGSQVILYRTPLCGVAQGAYVEDSALPAYAMIFSDTGNDDDYTIKLSFYGWGTFYVANAGDAYCHLEVRKGVKIECGSLAKKFETTDIWETRIPSSTVLSSETVKSVSVSYEDDSSNPSLTIYWDDDTEALTISTAGSMVSLGGTSTLHGTGAIWVASE